MLEITARNKRYATCKCPYHNDKHASAVIYNADKKFVCFTCHVVKPLEEVLRFLGIDAEDFDIDREEFVMPDLLAENFTYSLPTARALEYLNDRGVDTMRLPHYVASPKNDSGLGFLFETMLGKAIGMQIRLFPEHVRAKNVRYILQGERSEMFGSYKEYMTGKYKYLAAFEKAFATLRVQQISDIYNLGIATICTVGSHIQSNLLKLVDLNTVFFFDNDAAGRRAGDFVKSRGFRVIIPRWPADEMTSVDLADMLGKVYAI